MPSQSKAQQRLFAVALHNPSELSAKNSGLASLPKSTLHDFAATPRTGLPNKVRKVSIASMMKRKKPNGGVS